MGPTFPGQICFKLTLATEAANAEPCGVSRVTLSQVMLPLGRLVSQSSEFFCLIHHRQSSEDAAQRLLEVSSSGQPAGARMRVWGAGQVGHL